MSSEISSLLSAILAPVTGHNARWVKTNEHHREARRRQRLSLVLFAFTSVDRGASIGGTSY